ncbi:hypothetical protein Tco_0894008 [Tanacetum coccineum]|uniref:Uncharacterized protein n=1 Tax=Tanacetum coccineum TaxID=301880 RepID=A0ABQ5CAI8_9ASTR
MSARASRSHNQEAIDVAIVGMLADLKEGVRCKQVVTGMSSVDDNYNANDRKFCKDCIYRVLIKLRSEVNVEDEEPPLDFSHLEIAEMDVFGDDFGEQGQDVCSWLKTNDDVLQDDDFVGPEIDDLSDIKTSKNKYMLFCLRIRESDMKNGVAELCVYMVVGE